MRKQLLCRLSALVLCCLLLQPLLVRGVSLEPERECSLSLSYSKDGVAFGDLEIRIYRVAQAFSDGTYSLIAPFSSYPVNIHGITAQTEWRDTAATLAAYIVSDQLSPSRTGKTDPSGTVTFGQLETGLYLVRGLVTENDSGTYIFEDFLVYLPTPLADGSFDYQVEARPKCTGFVPKTEYKVLKLWKDAGNSAARPQAVTIDILKDGILQQTAVLSSENNWSHSWLVSADDTGIWTVTERDVPNGYTVTVSESEGTFTVTNTRAVTPGAPPQTGDSFAFWPWVMALCLSGSLLILLGIRRRRAWA